MKKFWNDESGVLTFEWILLLTLLVIGIVGGLAAVRDAYIVELASAAQAIGALDTSYVIQFPVRVTLEQSTDIPATGTTGIYYASSAYGSVYVDNLATVNLSVVTGTTLPADIPAQPTGDAKTSGTAAIKTFTL